MEGSGKHMGRKIKEWLQSFHAEGVFWETEKSSNVMMAYGMLMMSAFFLISAILMAAWQFYLIPVVSVITRALYLVCFILPALYCLWVKGDRHWLKYVLMLSFSIGIGVLSITGTHATVLMIVLPVALSTRYFSAAFTRATAVLMGLVYTVAVWLIAYFDLCGKYVGEYDLNYVALPAGSILTIGEGQWLLESLMETGIDKAATMYNMMTMALPVRLIEFALLSAICVAVARRGHRMVLNEAKNAAESAHREKELMLAADIQLSALPREFPAFPEHGGIEVCATMCPAREVGGDFYDYFRIDDDRIALVVADVSDKGVPAALFMMRGKTMIKNLAQRKLSPAEVFTAVNAQLCENNDADLFITAWLGILEISTGELTYVNAGHCLPFLHRSGEAEFVPLEPVHGLVLACFDDTKYEQSTVQLNAGDELFLYTDGVTEATNAALECYGEARTAEFLQAHSDVPLQDLLTQLKADVDAFVGDAMQFDDITMLMLRLKKAGKSE